MTARTVSCSVSKRFIDLRHHCSEGGGIVESIGAGITDVAVGDHVIPVSVLASAFVDLAHRSSHSYTLLNAEKYAQSYITL